MGFLEPSLARELALKKRFRDIPNSFSEDDDFVKPNQPSHKGKGIGKGKSKRASTPPPPGKTTATVSGRTTTTATTTNKKTTSPRSSTPPPTVVPPPPPFEEEDPPVPYDDMPLNAQSQITDADRGAIVCQFKIDQLSEDLKKRGLTIQKEQELMEEIALQTAQLEVNNYYNYFVPFSISSYKDSFNC